MDEFDPLDEKASRLKALEALGTSSTPMLASAERAPAAEEKSPWLTYKGPEDKGLEAPHVDPISLGVNVATGGIGALVPNPKNIILNAVKSEANKRWNPLSGDAFKDKIAGIRASREASRAVTKGERQQGPDLSGSYGAKARMEQQAKNRAMDAGQAAAKYKKEQAEAVNTGAEGVGGMDPETILAALKRLKGES